MKYLLRITLAATLFANSAYALSCMRPNLARTFNNAAASKDTFHVAYGKIKPTQKVVDPNKNTTDINNKKSYSVKAEFTGGFLGFNGFGKSKTKPIRVNVSCLGAWCGGFPNSADDMIVFLKRTPDGMTVDSGPCGGDIKFNPSEEELNIIKSCMRNGKCSKRQISDLDKN